jgi:hypothetical protein
MITTDNLDQIAGNITEWTPNTGVVPECRADEVVIMKFSHGSYAFTGFPDDFGWSPNMVARIVEYAVVPCDVGSKALGGTYPEWTPVDTALPQTIPNDGYPDQCSPPVLVLYNDGGVAVAYTRQYIDEADSSENGEVNWITDCAEGWCVTSSVIGWMHLPTKRTL